MIRHLLFLVVQQLNEYILQFYPNLTPPKTVVAGNVGLSVCCGGSATYMNNKIVVSMVNINEEETMKNSAFTRSVNQNYEKEAPPTFVNVYLLFSSCFHADGDDTNDEKNYLTSLKRLSHVIEFFQGKNCFTLQNTPDASLLHDTMPLDDPLLTQLQEVEFNLELVSLSFEQANYLWGTLGGKQMPYAMYKAYIVPIKRNTVLDRGALIEDIQSHSVHLTNMGQ